MLRRTDLTETQRAMLVLLHEQLTRELRRATEATLDRAWRERYQVPLSRVTLDLLIRKGLVRSIVDDDPNSSRVLELSEAGAAVLRALMR